MEPTEYDDDSELRDKVSVRFGEVILMPKLLTVALLAAGFTADG